MTLFAVGADESGLQQRLQAHNYWDERYGHAWIAVKRYTSEVEAVSHPELFTAFVESIGEPLVSDLKRNLAEGYPDSPATFRERAVAAVRNGLALEGGVLEDLPVAEVEQFFADIEVATGPIVATYTNEKRRGNISYGYKPIDQNTFELAWFVVGPRGCGLLLIFGED